MSNQNNLNEAETRADLIDKALTAAGWGVVEGSRIRREIHITLGRIEGKGRGTRLIVDYVLEYRNIRLAVIEAKKASLHYTEGVAQAKLYAESLPADAAAKKLGLRFAYSSNGRRIYAIDMQTGHEGDVDRYPTPDELWQMTFPVTSEERDRFVEVPMPDKSGSEPSRYYQEIAIQRVLEAVIAKQKRILLTLATGTGKTFIAFQLAWKLFSTRWNLQQPGTRQPRILFLADRNLLADQAFNAFTAFSSFKEDALVRIDPDIIRKKGRVPKNGNIFFTIFQTFMSGPLKDGQPSPAFGEYPPDFFDFIIIDECHRGGANDESSWRAILEYFSPAVQLGLTATPKRDDNVDTYAYFGEPVYSYSLKDGINDGFLTPFKIHEIESSLDEYTYADDDTVLEGEIDPEKNYGEQEFNQRIEIKERERYRVQTFMQMINQREKTLVFCASQPHAAFVRDLVNQMKQSRDPNYCHRVTANDGELGEQHLRTFQNNEKSIPTILTTSRKLSTGVDARNVRNIILLRPIKSMIEFKQIVGRGTRLFDGKAYFTIYDFVKAHEHFNDPEWDGPPLSDDRINDDGGAEDPSSTIDYEAASTNKPLLTRERIGEDAGYTTREIIKVQLSDGKERMIQHTVSTRFWHSDGKPITAQQFLQNLFGVLPELFANEAELRRLWSDPTTRKELLQGLAQRDFGSEQLAEMQRLVDAEQSDIFDVLAYIAYAQPPISRQTRAERASNYIQQQPNDQLTAKQKEFLKFVLAQYVKVGVDQLALDTLESLLYLKYNNSINDATADLGKVPEIKRVFRMFQRYLYEEKVA